MAQYFEGNLVAPGGRFAICVARFNSFITEELLKGALDAFVRHGIEESHVDVFRCPGTFELGGLVRKVVDTGNYVGVVTLGAVIRGGTPHFEHVAGQGTAALAAISAEGKCPVTFGVLTCDTVEQAMDRAGIKSGNKGADATIACIEMVNLYTRISDGLESKRRLSPVEGKKK